MQQVATARTLLRRLHPWVRRAIHVRWTTRRTFYQSELDALLIALQGERGRLSPELRVRLEGFLTQLYREWFPRTWRRDPTFSDILTDFRWWLGVAERWSEPAARPKRSRRRSEPLAEQPEELCRMLGLPANCTEGQFIASWRGFVKRNHPDLNPDQTPEERRRFAEALALRRR
jgi:hypothetical protein